MKKNFPIGIIFMVFAMNSLLCADAIHNAAESNVDIPALTAGATQNVASRDNPRNRFYGRLGVVFVTCHPGVAITSGGQVIPDTGVKVTNSVTAVFEAGYFFTDKIAFSVEGGIPAKPSATGTGSIYPYGNLASVTYGPAMGTAHYHFRRSSALQPYVGGGAAYAIILKDHDATIQKVDIRNNWGVVAQAGADYMFTKRWGAYVDFKEMWLSVNGTGSVDLVSVGLTPAKAHIRVNPSLISSGVTYRF